MAKQRKPKQRKPKGLKRFFNYLVEMTETGKHSHAAIKQAVESGKYYDPYLT